MRSPPYLSAAELATLLPLAAVDALEAVLRTGLDPGADPPRSSVATEAGELLLMPSSAAGPLGVKLVTVGRDHPGRALPRVKASTCSSIPDARPSALIDGTAHHAAHLRGVGACGPPHGRARREADARLRHRAPGVGARRGDARDPADRARGRWRASGGWRSS